jgi:hypothetical protein
MSPVIAFYIVTWAAIVVLFLGLAAVLREVRLLRGIVSRDPEGFASAQPDISLGGRFANGKRRQIVLAAESGCPLCLAVIERLARRAAGERAAGERAGQRGAARMSGPFKATLLTHESPAVWDRVAGRLQIVSDRESWRAISHLAPPVLMLVDGSGRVRRMLLPVREQEVDSVLGEWSDLTQERISGVADVRADS